ncbi:MAG: Rieske 2Fe-2S domain-containing protein, partial [Brooklawnia sp.]|nr:Rieske 2Fe-2S domain-containing protein [Brooklawnia sp.]
MNPVLVATLDELGDVPLGVEVPEADLELALVRIGDEVFAIRDECSHGKVRLSEGDVDVRNCAIEC